MPVTIFVIAAPEVAGKYIPIPPAARPRSHCEPAAGCCKLCTDSCLTTPNSGRTFEGAMPEQNASRALQDWIHEMIQQRRAGFRAGAGGSPNGDVLWLYFSRGDAVESRLVMRAGIRDGKP